MDPEPLHPLVLIIRIIAVERGEPCLGRGDDLARVPRTQLDLRAGADPVLGTLEQLQQGLDRSAGDLRRRREGAPLAGHPIDPPVSPVAARVAEVVLHVADDRVLPIEKIDRAVGPGLDVRRPEVHDQSTSQHRLDLGAGEARALVVDPVAEDALDSRCTQGDEQISLELLRGNAGSRLGPPRPGRGRTSVLVDRPVGGWPWSCRDESNRPARSSVPPVIRARARCRHDDDVLAPVGRRRAHGGWRTRTRQLDLETSATSARSGRSPALAHRTRRPRRTGASRPACGGTSPPGSRARRRGRAGSCWRCGGCRPSRARSGRARGGRPYRRRRCP